MDCALTHEDVTFYKPELSLQAQCKWGISTHSSQTVTLGEASHLFFITKNNSEEIAEELRCRTPLGISYKAENLKTDFEVSSLSYFLVANRKKLHYRSHAVGEWVLMQLKEMEEYRQTAGRQDDQATHWLWQSIFQLAFLTENVNLLSLLSLVFLSLKQKII